VPRLDLAFDLERIALQRFAPRRPDARDLLRAAVVPVSLLAVATVAVYGLERALGLPDASVLYLPAVVATAIVTGTAGAIASAIVAILLYDFLFTQPIHTLAIDDPAEWLSLALLLFVAIVVGELAALQRSRADLASARERQARALFQVSRALATRASTATALREIAEILREEAQMLRVAIALGPDDASERVVAESSIAAHPDASGVEPQGQPVPTLAVQWVLQRTPGDEPARWRRVHQPVQRLSGRSGVERGVEALRVRIVANDVTFGSIWANRERTSEEPDRTNTRLLAATADQLGQVLAHDRLQAEAQAAEIARQSDALKSALLQSVSHDFRTPLATIRAAAGTLRPGELTAEERRASTEAIEREVEYLDRLVRNLLDLSRIEAGALRADREVFELDDLVARTIGRLEARLSGRPLAVDVDAVPVLVDPVFLDESVTNLIENAIRHTAAGTPVRISTAVEGNGFVRLTVEDGGPGVPGDALEHLFEKFYQAAPRPRTARASRTGTGIGLAVVRGLCEAMGATASARPSQLGGLAIDLDLPAATLPAELVVATPP
jgi:two-component system sensor histidine kinase KdpD